MGNKDESKGKAGAAAGAAGVTGPAGPEFQCMSGKCGAGCQGCVRLDATVRAMLAGAAATDLPGVVVAKTAAGLQYAFTVGAALPGGGELLVAGLPNRVSGDLIVDVILALRRAGAPRICDVADGAVLAGASVGLRVPVRARRLDAAAVSLFMSGAMRTLPAADRAAFALQLVLGDVAGHVSEAAWAAQTLR